MDDKDIKTFGDQKILNSLKDKPKENNGVITKTEKLDYLRNKKTVSNTTFPMLQMISNAMNAENRRLENPDSFKKNPINVSNVMSFKGERQNIPINDFISTELGKQYSYLTGVNNYGFGSNRFAFQSKTNKFMEKNMPKLITALKLFISDVCDGAYFGDSSSSDRKNYKFFQDGVEVSDTSKISKMENLLEVTKEQQTFATLSKCSEIDKRATYISRRDGLCFVHLIPYSKIAKELYIKFVMKEAKIKEVKKQLKKKGKSETKSVIKVKNSESLDKVNNYLTKLGMESVSLTSDLTSILDEDIVKNIPHSFLKFDTEIIIDKDSLDDMKLSQYEIEELNRSESYRSFMKRMLSNKTHYPIYNNKIEKTHTVKDKKSNNKTEERIINETLNRYFTIESSNFDKVNVDDLLDQIFQNDNFSYFSTESIDENIQTLSMNLDEFDSETLINTSFESIYSMNLLNIDKKRKDDLNVSCFSTEAFNDYSKFKCNKTLTPFELLTLKTIENTNDVLKTKFSMETQTEVGNIIEVENFTSIGKGTEDNTINSTKIDKLISEVKEKHKSESKIDRMFAHIKGEAVEIIDNTNIHVIMSGDRVMGIFVAVLSVDDVRNLMVARNMVYGGAIGAGAVANMNGVAIDDEDMDQIIGKTMFGDHLLPILEKVVDKNFIKDNIALGNAILRLIEENDVSKLGFAMSGNPNDGLTSATYTRVKFIPVDELIVYRNGYEGMGESVFSLAETPALMNILLREGIMSYYLWEGRGISFLTIPQGASEINGEVGQSAFVEELEEAVTIDRISLRNMYSNNTLLGHKIVRFTKDSSISGDLELRTIDMPQLNFDQDFLMSLEQEATEIVGYNSAIFSSRDGNIELARKLSEMNGSKVLDIMDAQRYKIKSTSQLATTLLRLRGGEEYANVVAIWNPPTPSKINDDIQSEVIERKTKILDSFIELLEKVYGEDEEFEASKKGIYVNLLKEFFQESKIFSDIENKFEEAKGNAKIEASTKVTEVDDSDSKSKKKK